MPRVDRLEPADWARFRAVRLRALQDAPDAFARTHTEEAAHPPRFWVGRLESPDAATFVAAARDADVGMVGVTHYRGQDAAAGLFGMWVAPEARGAGIGEQLARAVVAWARARGFRRVLLDVADDNAPAIGLYARLGFAPNGAAGTLPPPRAHIREHQRELTLDVDGEAG